MMSNRVYTVLAIVTLFNTLVMAQFPMGTGGMNNTASAPSFVQPQAQESGYGWLEAEFPIQNAQFAWIPPVANNAPTTQFVYDFSIMRVVPGQEVVDAADYGTIAFQQKGLMTAMCMIPQNVLESLKNSGTEYFVAIVTARPVGGQVTMINDGRSEIMLLRFPVEQEPCNTDSIDNNNTHR